MIKLAELQWGGIGGEYWRRHGVDDLKMLRAFSTKEFWLHFHGSLHPSPSSRGSSSLGRTSVVVHAIAEARGLAYVIDQAAHSMVRFAT